MQTAVATEAEWTLQFAAGYIVPPCRVDQAAIENSVLGSAADVAAVPLDPFLGWFIESLVRCAIEITFAPEDGQQESSVRTLVRAVALGSPDEKETAALALARRLAGVTRKRSGTGLFVVLVGSLGSRTRVLLWKFPADRFLEANVALSPMSIRVIEDAFSNKSNYFKAAMFEGTSADTSFWEGRVDDRQAKDKVTEAAEFWVEEFLAARPAITDQRGSKILARALKATIKEAPTAEVKEKLIAAGTVIKGQVDRKISLEEFASSYLPESSRETFLNAAGPGVAETVFTVDTGVLDHQLRFKYVTLDDRFTVHGPLDDFDAFVRITSPDSEGRVEISMRGVVTSEAVRTQ